MNFIKNSHNGGPRTSDKSRCPELARHDEFWTTGAPVVPPAVTNDPQRTCVNFTPSVAGETGVVHNSGVSRCAPNCGQRENRQQQQSCQKWTAWAREMGGRWELVCSGEDLDECWRRLRAHLSRWQQSEGVVLAGDGHPNHRRRPR
jgi:hypothetical protein